MGDSPLSSGGLKVRSSRFEYEVIFCDDFATELERQLRPGDYLLVDENVARLHAGRIGPLCAKLPHRLIAPSEPAKSYAAIGDVIEGLIRDGFRRNHRLVAIGGGIVQDITAFAASILYRGVGWIFVPTNLLAQCDSCIGSKTSVNFGSRKNQLGGFWPPRVILSDQSLLATLPREEIRSGIGEMLHYFLLTGREDFERITREFDAAFTDSGVLRGLIRRSLEIKRAMVEVDEFDEGPRNVFNYGHSFGHALESYSGFAIPHGIAVSFGMDIANQVSVARGLMPAAAAAEMRRLLERNWKPTDPGEVEVGKYLDGLKHDKKNVDSELRVILSRGLGQMFVTKIARDDSLVAAVAECFRYYHQPHLR